MPDLKSFFREAICSRSSRCEGGFSLVEVLVSFAITSLLVLALFQTLFQWSLAASRAENATWRVQDALAAHSALASIMTGLTSAWPDEPAGRFEGDAQRFSGLTSMPPQYASKNFERFTVEIKRGADGTASLTYSGSGIVYRLLSARPNQQMRFRYMNAELEWIESWETAASLPAALEFCIMEAGEAQICMVLPTEGAENARRRLDAPGDFNAEL